MNTKSTLAIVFVTSFVSVPALAEEPKKPAEKPVASVAVAMPEPAATATADQPVAAPSTTPAPAGGGFVIEVSGGAAFQGGSFAKNVDVSAANATAELRLGGYVTNHVGILGGVQIGTGSVLSGCDSCSSTSFQIPVVVQYSLRDRRKGLYFEGGAALLSTMVEVDPSGSTIAVGSPVDVKVGVGYRVKQTRNTSIDVRLGADFGQYSNIAIKSPDVSASSDIPSEKSALHYNIGLSAGYAFAP